LSAAAVGVAFAFIGSLTRSSIFFTFPAALMLASKRVRESSPFKLSRPVVAGCYCMVGLGLAIMALGFGASVMRAT
jgi:hypothetical protein